MKNYFTRAVLLLAGIASCVGTNIATAQEKVSKTIEQSLGNLQGGHLEIDHRRGDVKVVKASGNEATFKIDIVVEGRDKSEMEEFIAAFEISTTGSGIHKKIETNDQIESWINTPVSRKVKLENGDVFTGIKQMSMNMIVSVPDLEKISITNRYEDIHLQPMSGDVEINLYSGELHAENIEGDVDLTLKYGEATFGTSKNLNMELYEAEIHMGDTDKAIINSKYGEVEMGDVGSLELSSYEDDIKIGTISGKSNLEVKYGDLEIESLQDAEIDFYETDLNTSQVSNLKGSCKYGKLGLGDVNTIELLSDYEIEITASTCTELLLHESKYGHFEIGTLSKKAKVLSYETTVEVENIESIFESLWIESKYDEMSFPLPDNLSFSLDAEMKYGDLDYNRSAFTNHDRQEKSSTVTVTATTANAKAKVYIRSYETEVDLTR